MCGRVATLFSNHKNFFYLDAVQNKLSIKLSYIDIKFMCDQCESFDEDDDNYNWSLGACIIVFSNFKWNVTHIGQISPNINQLLSNVAEGLAHSTRNIFNV